MNKIISTLSLFLLGILSISGYFIIDNSDSINHYFKIAATNTSGFRFIILFGILKYGALLLGLSFIFIGLIQFIKNLNQK